MARWPRLRAIFWTRLANKSTLWHKRRVNVLIKIKKLVVARRVIFTEKARTERYADHLTVEDILESIVNAPSINKVINSTSPNRSKRKEKLYVIISSSYEGKLIYTKGTIRKLNGVEEFYILISSKWSQI